jgi:aryl-alcohol dehydrogenase-like predicted oxidoreductase
VLAQTMTELAAKGEVPQSFAASKDPLAFLVHEGGATSLTDAAYRFARYQPGADVILFGTGDAAHLQANVASILSPPLPPADVERLHSLFGALRGVGLVLPDREQQR